MSTDTTVPVPVVPNLGTESLIQAVRELVAAAFSFKEIQEQIDNESRRRVSGPPIRPLGIL